MKHRIVNLYTANAVVLVAVAALLLARSAGAQAVPQSPKADTAASAGDAKQGLQVFKSHGCYECHGYEGQGAQGTGARIGPPPLPLAGFIRYVRHPAGEMPPYGPKLISDAELTDVYAYLQSRPKPSDPKTIPQLQ